MSKEQERAALAKIEKIIQEAGPDSYIGITFAGITEQAADNITNDFACNYKQAYEKTLDLYNDAKKEIANLVSVCKEHMAETDASDKLLKEKREENFKLAGDLNRTQSQLAAAKEENETLKADIVTLKAKLYDLMTQ